MQLVSLETKVKLISGNGMRFIFCGITDFWCPCHCTNYGHLTKRAIVIDIIFTECC